MPGEYRGEQGGPASRILSHHRDRGSEHAFGLEIDGSQPRRKLLIVQPDPAIDRKEERAQMGPNRIEQRRAAIDLEDGLNIAVSQDGKLWRLEEIPLCARRLVNGIPSIGLIHDRRRWPARFTRKTRAARKRGAVEKISAVARLRFRFERMAPRIAATKLTSLCVCQWA